MNRSTPWRLARTLLLGAMLVAGTSTFAATIPDTGLSVRVAEATVAQADKEDRRPKNKNAGSDDDEDHKLNGQVLEIDTIKDPPELIVASMDGETVVRVLKTDEIAINGIHLGDHIQARGEKQSEVLFEATQLSVSSRYGAESNENKDDKDD